MLRIRTSWIGLMEFLLFSRGVEIQIDTSLSTFLCGQVSNGAY